MGKQVVKPSVGIFSCSVSTELPQGPEFSAIHGWMNPARVRRSSREPQVFLIVEVVQVSRGIEAFDRLPGNAGEFLLAFWGLAQQRIERLFLPLFLELITAILSDRKFAHSW